MQTKKIRLGENFFDRLRQVIKYTGKKKSDFAKALNVSPGNLSDWLSGRSQPDGLILIRINEIFGIDLNWMISGEGEMTLLSGTKQEVKYSQSRPAGERLLDQEGRADTNQEIAQKLQKSLGQEMREKPVQTVSFNRQDVFNLVVRAMLRMEQEEIYEIKVLAARLLGDEFERSKTDVEREKR